MATPTHEFLIEQANLAAQKGEWQDAFNFLNHAYSLVPDDPGLLSGLGTCLIQLNKPAEAVPYFEKLVSLMGESPDAYNNLGVACMLAGDIPGAETAYRKATDLSPNNLQAWKNLAILLLQQDDKIAEGVQILAAIIKSNPTDVETLNMMAQVYEEGEDFESAAALYRKVLSIEPDQSIAKASLTRLEKMAVPADLTRIARPEHAKKLAALKSLGSLKKEPVLPPAPKAQPEEKPQPTPVIEIAHQQAAVLFVGPPDINSDVRLMVVARRLAEMGIRVKAALKPDSTDIQQHTAFVFSNPHIVPEHLQSVVRCLQAEKRVIIDLDRDFSQMPADDPGYKSAGPGNNSSLKLLDGLLGQVSMVTVPNVILAERYGNRSRKIKVIPYTWNRLNPLWEKPAQPHDGLNIGILDRYTTANEAAVLKNAIKRLVDEEPDLLWVTGSAIELYNALNNLPDERKLLLPPSNADEFPFTLSNLDILLLPHRGGAYEQAFSDLPLLEAGVRGVPWVATPLPAYKEWQTGGLFVQERGDWYTAIRRLVKDSTLRNKLGNTGKQKAQERESAVIVKHWIEVLGL
ncbi:MAG TPA: tetratricopeptide repeat protein [Anaerolineaceae bacterium]